MSKQLVLPGHDTRLAFDKSFVLRDFIYTYEMRTQQFKALAVAAPWHKLVSDHPAWTLLQINSSINPSAKIGDSSGTNLAATVFSCLERGLLMASVMWRGLTQQLETILGFESQSMDTEESELDLFEDATFSKSRRYFWAINGLTRFIRTIEATIRMWQGNRDEWLKRYQEIGTDIPLDVKKHISVGERHCAELEVTCQRQRKMLAEVTLRRDGLFNASAVMESRQASLLGQDVRLLTYVTIFFLPLAFSTSLWSINETYSRHTLVWVAMTTAVGTYAVTFNLNWLAGSFAKLYEKLRAPILQRMCDDEAGEWNARGKGFTWLPAQTGSKGFRVAGAIVRG
ncbi:MAG: hypothetical protein Q9216_003990 [Gyalolechia sp. 2 TL-2023]